MTTSTTPQPEEFRLVLRSVPDADGVPTIHRLRRFLKMALRGYGLKCTSAERVTDGNTTNHQEESRPCTL
jgi:hypothetical protein